jgi:2-keto-4-pentenoate hydratase/2-oxohepta-3-ene-1,7-dioic acid hydratase in catechol pathway
MMIGKCTTHTTPDLRALILPLPLGLGSAPEREVKDPNNLTVIADIDGEVFAEDHTSNYRFTIEHCISEASRYFTLEPGDIISFETLVRVVVGFQEDTKVF